MPTAITSLLSGFSAAVSGLFNYLTGRSALNNAPAIQDNAGALADEKLKEQLEADDAAAHKTGDLTQVRKDGAE